MDVDVKNSIDLLLTACRQIDASRHNDLLCTLVAQDLRSFIEEISTENAEDRTALFDQIYLFDIKNKMADVAGNTAAFPAALSELCRIDCTALKNKNIRLGELYITALREIGKHYIFSKHDKKDIDQKRFTEIVRAVQSDVSLSNQSSSAVSRPGEKEAPVLQKDSPIQTPKEDVLSEIPEETLEELLDQLNGLIGLEGVKNEVSSLINLLKINKLREARGHKAADVSKHLVFLGNPGTGKTTVARLLSKIYRQLGALEKGQLVEVDRAGLVAGYVGQTALKTKEKIDEAMGGILFIDEAYTLVKDGNDFGQEAIDTILKAMEDNRDSFVVIVAGYPEPMSNFLESNPGLKSRFNKNIYFEDYTEDELAAIFHSYCEKYGLRLSADAEERLVNHLREICRNRPDNFANGREMRNLFETAYSNQANRLAALNDITDDALNEITIEDLGITDTTER